MHNKTLKSLLAFFFSFIFLSSPILAGADSLEDELARLEQEIQNIQQQKNSLQQQLDQNNSLLQGYNSQLSQIYTEASIINKDIEQLVLEIKQLELNIDALEKDIAQKQSEVAASEQTFENLEKESNKRIFDNYMNFRLYGQSDRGSDVLGISNVNKFFKDSQYKEIIQSGTNILMTEVARLRLELLEKKKELNEKLVEVKKDREIVVVKKTDLDSKKADLDVKMESYFAQIGIVQSQANSTQNQINQYTEEEILKNAQAELIKQEIFNDFNPSDQGEYVLTGKYIGRQGSTGLSTGPHLHFSVQVNNGWQDPCAYLPGGVCGYGSSLAWPLDPVSYYTSGFGDRCFDWGGSVYCDFHTGIDIVGNMWNAPIFAAHNGYLYKGVDPYGALYIIICENTNCSVGMKTGYWHLSQY